MRSGLLVATQLVFLSALGSAACSPDKVGPPPPPPVGSFLPPPAPDAGASIATASERALAAAYVGALSSGPEGLNRLAPWLDDDVHFTFPGLSDVRGKSAALKARDTLFEPFEPRTARLERVLRTSSAQSVEWQLTGSQSQMWFGIAPTGQPVRVEGLSLLFTKDDGTITDLHVVFDEAAVKVQLGAAPKSMARFYEAHLTDGGTTSPGGDAGASDAATPASTSAEADAGPPLVLDADNSASEKTNVALARGWLDALESGNLADYEAAVTDNLVVSTASRPTPLRGKADVRAYFKNMRKAIGQLDTTVINAWGVGPYAVIEYTIAGEQLGPILWVKAQQDGTVRLHVVDIIEFAGSHIDRVRRYDNPGEIIADPTP